MGIFGTIIISLIVFIVVFLLCRELICWYYKINRIVELMEEQNGLLKKMLGESIPQEVSETITQMDYNAQKESVETEKLMPDGLADDVTDEEKNIPGGWAECVTEDEKIDAMGLVDKLDPKEVIVKNLSKNRMVVWSLRNWVLEKEDSNYKLIYVKSI